MRTMRTRLIQAIIVLVITLPLCYGAVIPGNTWLTIHFIPKLPEAVILLMFGMVLLTLATLMRIRVTR